MILGMSLEMFTKLHVFISLVGIASGMAVLFGMLTLRKFPILTGVFLATTALTSLTGFLFPNKTITPGIVLGILSMIALLLAFIALYGKKLAGGWRGTYVITATLALWFNVFVLFAQSFAKISVLHDLAPTQASPVFGITQLVVLVLFIFIGIRAFRKFRPA